MSRWSQVFLMCVSDGVPKRSILIALVVGSVLNLINQGDVLIDGGRIDFLKLALTYAVPCFVATLRRGLLSPSCRERTGRGARC